MMSHPPNVHANYVKEGLNGFMKIVLSHPRKFLDWERHSIP